MAVPHHHKLPDHWALLCGRAPMDQQSFKSEHLQIVFNNTAEPWCDDRAHAHSRSDEVYIVIEGSMNVEIEGVLVVVASGEYLCVPKGAQHQLVGISTPVKSFVIRAPSVEDKVLGAENGV